MNPDMRLMPCAITPYMNMTVRTRAQYPERKNGSAPKAASAKRRKGRCFFVIVVTLPG